MTYVNPKFRNKPRSRSQRARDEIYLSDDHELCFDGEKTRLNADGAPAHLFFPAGRHLAEGLINGRGSLWLEHKSKARPFNEVIAKFVRNTREYTLGRSSKGRYYLRIAIDDRYNLMSEIRCQPARLSETHSESVLSGVEPADEGDFDLDGESLAA